MAGGRGKALLHLLPLAHLRDAGLHWGVDGARLNVFWDEVLLAEDVEGEALVRVAKVRVQWPPSL